MTKGGFRKVVWIGAISVSALVASQPAAGQTPSPQGWPETTTPTVTVTAGPAAKPAPAAASSSSASAARPAAPKVRAATVVKPAATPSAAVEAPAAVAKPANWDAASVALPQLLQQQSELLARLAAEIEAQRTAMIEQQEKIKALETRSAAAAATAAAAPPAPIPSTPTVPPTAPAKVAPPSPPPPPPPAITVETGGIKLKMAGLFQGWYTATSGATVDTFRLRRTELKFSGDMSARVKWALMFDAAKALSLSSTTATVGGQQVLTGSNIGQSGRVLQDAFVTVNLSPAVIVEVGQQKIPLSMEGPQSSGKLETIERALFMSDKARGGGYGDVRDLGVMLRGKVAGGQIEYFGGVFNGLGESQNDLDKNDQKDLVGRAIVRPAFVKGLQFGGSFARDGIGTLNPATGRRRHGVEMLYTQSAFALKSELMFGQDGPLNRRGAYVQATRRLHRSLQGLFRFDMWDPDTRSELGADKVTERDYVGGLTYTIANSGAWLQLNFIQKTFGDVVAARSVFVANIQSTW